MYQKNIKFLLIFLFLFIGGCDPYAKPTICITRVADADWIVVQYADYAKEPFNCWKLSKTCLMPGPPRYNSGIAWEDASGQLIWITGRYNSVRVANSNYEEAAKSIGIELSRCKGGKYVAEGNSEGIKLK